MTAPDTNHFDPSDYDDDGQLKTPVFLLITMAFLSRYPLILMLSAFSTLMLKRRGITFEGIGLPPIEGLAASLPAIVVLLIILFRHKLDPYPWVRGILRRGAEICIAIGIIQLYLDGRILWSMGHLTSVWIVIEAVLIVYSVAYFLRSAKASQYFRVYGKTGRDIRP